MAFEIGQSEASQAALLGFIDGIRRMAGSVRGARLDLNKHHGAAIDGNQVQFADVVALRAGNDHIAQLAEIAGGCILATAAEGARGEERG